MNKQILVYILLICIIWGGVYFFQEVEVEQNSNSIQNTAVITVKHDEKKQNTNTVLETSNKPISSTDIILEDTIIIEEKPEPRFEEILYPDEYDFDDLHAGSVYEKAGTKIKADFSYMLDKKLGDEVTIHFPNASITGKIINYEADNGPEGIKAYIYRMDVNNSIREDGSFPEQIMMSVFEQNGKIYNVDGSFETPNANGQFYLENGFGYFTTKEEYGNAVMELGIKTD